MVHEEEGGAVEFLELFLRVRKHCLGFGAGFTEEGDCMEEGGGVVGQGGGCAFSDGLGRVDGPGSVAVEACVEEGGVRLIHYVYGGHEVGEIGRGERSETKDLGAYYGGGMGFYDCGNDDAVRGGAAATDGEEEVRILAGICYDGFSRGKDDLGLLSKTITRSANVEFERITYRCFQHLVCT